MLTLQRSYFWRCSSAIQWVKPLPHPFEVEIGGDVSKFEGIGDMDPTPARSRMPFELWADIFELVHWQASSDKLNQSRVPWILSKICHQWRLFALHTPSLWSIVYIDTQFIRCGAEYAAFRARARPSNPIPHVAGRLQLQLERSRDCPLEVIIQHRSHIARIGVLWSVLYRHIHRAWSIDVEDRIGERETDSLTSHMALAMSRDPPYYPFLRELRWYNCHASASDAPFASFNKAPNLRSLIFRSGIITPRARDSIPFAQLTEVLFDRVSADWCTVLPLLKAAKKLQFDDIREWAGSESQIDLAPCILRKLQSLAISNHNDRNFTPLPIQAAPDLRDLVVNIVFRKQGPFQMDLTAVGEFLKRSPCELLTSLTINGIGDTSCVIQLKTYLFLSTPSLTHLYLGFDRRYQDSMNVIIRTLSQTGRTTTAHALPTYCPSLHFLRIGVLKLMSNWSDRILEPLDLDALIFLMELRRPFGLEEVELHNTVFETTRSNHEACKKLKEEFGVRFISDAELEFLLEQEDLYY